MFSSTFHAQTNYARVAFIDPAKALAAHPAGDSVAAIQQRQEAELNPILQQIQDLQAKAQSGQPLTPEETDTGDLLVRTLQDRQQRFAEEILAASEPAVNAVNNAIITLSQQYGYTLVMDGNIAGQNGLGLVVYAQEGLDITDQVIAYVQTNP